MECAAFAKLHLDSSYKPKQEISPDAKTFLTEHIKPINDYMFSYFVFVIWYETGSAVVAYRNSRVWRFAEPIKSTWLNADELVNEFQKNAPIYKITYANYMNGWRFDYVYNHPSFGILAMMRSRLAHYDGDHAVLSRVRDFLFT